ncbi:hypothetical protein [Ferrimicrobium acidiphilum]|jgi:hypothetical protein|uniref:hypothetical protein n=1 Tax=Ferrimicrobium acidiphilum TaxID=121039 RepID=UPI0023F4FEFB|nr:hypothetical protein [Ferrimicrobium acidiphilum]
MVAVFTAIVEVIVILFGINIAYDAAIFFHGYNIAGNIAQTGVNAGVSQVSAFNAINGNDHYVGQYAISQAMNAIPNNTYISASCYATTNNRALACTVSYKVRLPLFMSSSGIPIVAQQTVASIPYVN